MCIRDSISIHPERKTVSVKHLENGEIFEEKYDKLILSPGAKPTQDVYKRQAMYQDKVLSHLDAGTHTIHPHSYFHG